MIASSVNKFTFDIQQVKESDYYKPFTDKNSLMVAHPGTKDVQLLQEAMDYVWESMPSLMGDRPRTPFADMLGRNRTVMVDADYVEWMLMTKGSVKAETIEDTAGSDSCPGIHSQYFYIKLNTDRFKESDFISPADNPNYLARVADAPQHSGDGWLYALQLVTNSPANDYFPPELLSANRIWIRQYSPSAEGSSLYGSWSSEATGYIRFRVPMNSHSQEGQITDKAMYLNVYFGPADKNGAPLNDMASRKQGKILPVLMMHFEQDFQMAVERALMFGRLSDRVLIDRTSKKGVQSGPGLQEFFEQGSVIDIGSTEKIIPRLEEAALHLFADRVAWQNRVIDVYTGSVGLRRVSPEIEEQYLLKGNDMAYNDIATKTNSAIPGFRALSLNPYVFEEITIPYVTKVRFHHWMMLDSPEMFHVIDPSTGMPVESGNFYIFDVGGFGSAMGSNLTMLQKSGEVDTFHCGTVSPVGPINSTNTRGYVSLHKRRTMDWVKEKWFGIRMRDTSRAIKLQNNIC